MAPAHSRRTHPFLPLLHQVDKKRAELYKTQFKPLSNWLKELYGDKVEKVTVSNRVDKTPVLIVTSQYGYSANMERIMKSQVEPHFFFFISSTFLFVNGWFTSVLCTNVISQPPH